jgi:hypothetical protein
VDVKKKQKENKKSKKKEKQKKYENACLFLFQGFFIMRWQKNKEGFNILIGSPV